MEIDFQNTIYTFYLSKESFNLKGLERCVPIGDYQFYCDRQTSVDICSKNGRTILIFGDCVDVVSGRSDNLSEYILDATSNVDGLVESERHLGGRYVVVYWDGKSIYLLCDATSSVPVFYLRKFDYCVCASNCSFIVNKHKLVPNPELLRIKSASPNGAALPFNVTSFSEIRQLLPNHYLHWTNGTTTMQRFVNMRNSEIPISPSEAAQKTLPMIMELARFYGQKYSLCCPITGGRDSRVVLSVLNYVYGSTSVPCYTIKHQHHNDTSGDVTVPRQLVNILGNAYNLINDEETPENIKQLFDVVFGKGKYYSQTLTIAYTIMRHYGKQVPVDGDIIGQVGKSSLFRDIPDSYATVGLFLEKLHNFSNLSRKYVKLWLEDIKQSEEKTSSFDLFCVEQRLGSWATQKHLIYNLLGQRVVNIFNSRSIIYEWVKVSQKDRIASSIHNEIIKLTGIKVLQTPYERTSKITRLIKSNWLFFYLGSMFKFYQQKWNYLLSSK